MNRDLFPFKQYQFVLKNFGYDCVYDAATWSMTESLRGRPQCDNFVNYPATWEMFITYVPVLLMRLSPHEAHDTSTVFYILSNVDASLALKFMKRVKREVSEDIKIQLTDVLVSPERFRCSSERLDFYRRIIE